MLSRKIALAVVLLVCLLKTAMHHKSAKMEDFRVYDTAAMLVRQHQSALIYDGADTGVDPQLRLANPQSAFAVQARAMGIDQVRLYVYPPLLADLMVPYTFARFLTAGRLWELTNVLALAAFVWLAASLLAVPWRSFGLLCIVVATLTFLPVLDALQWGQVTVLLLLLWTVGVFCYVRGWVLGSAAAFGLATAVKLTPLIVIAPFLLWKQARWVRSYLLVLAGCLGLVCIVNGPACVTDYFRHVMPAMSNGNPLIANKSLLSAFQILYVNLKGGDPTQQTTPIPNWVSTVGKASALLFLLIACGLVARRAAASSLHTRVITLSLFGVLSVGLSPVSWEHAYAICLLGLVCLWVEALRAEVPNYYFLVLVLCSLELSWFLLSFFFLKRVHGSMFGVAIFLTPLSAIGLVLCRLAMPEAKELVLGKALHTGWARSATPALPSASSRAT